MDLYSPDTYLLKKHFHLQVAKSPYFYREMYQRRKKLKYLYKFCRFVLPITVNFSAVEAVISYMYTGDISLLWNKPTASGRH